MKPVMELEVKGDVVQKTMVWKNDSIELRRLVISATPIGLVSPDQLEAIEAAGGRLVQ